MMNNGKTTSAARPRRTGNGKWCSGLKRLAIYLRDGLACCYCQAAVEDGVVLSLDHVECYSHGGSNDATNLVTSCRQCNSVRGNRSVADFAADVAGYLTADVAAREAKAAEIVARVAELTARQLPRAEAREMIARRGTAARAVAEIAGR